MGKTMNEERTREPQYQYCVELVKKGGTATLGLVTNHIMHDDPRHMVFLMARYKFVSKMLSGLDRVLEVGCGDAFAARLVQQEVKHLTVTDFDPVFIRDVQKRMDPDWPLEAKAHDMLKGPVKGTFDGAYSMDVIEHIAKKDETRFLKNIVSSLTKTGVLVIGTPSIQSQVHASAQSKAGHVNCKDAPELKELLSRFFHNVFVFSMNDEVVHTGYTPMAHYLLALCCGPKK